jgi:hypothetical protein
MSDGQLAVNTNNTSPGLFFKDSNGALVKAGPVHVGATAPNVSPAGGGQTGNTVGEMWLDTGATPPELKTWNGSAWISATGQEIGVSKLSNGTARQLLQTNAAGTDVEWASNIDIPGTLDVTGAAVFDSTSAHPLGTAALPTITFTGDPNTGLYSPGADQVGVTTGGVVRLTASTTDFVGTLPWRGQNGSVTAPALSFSGDNNTGVYWVSADTIGITTGGTQAVQWNATGDMTLPGVGATKLQAGTSAQRPGVPATGMVRYNSDITQFEGYNGTAWGTIGGGAKGAGADQMFFENDQVVTVNYTITSGKNAMSAGPVTINSGVTVTVPSGSVWTVV